MRPLRFTHFSDQLRVYAGGLLSVKAPVFQGFETPDLLKAGLKYMEKSFVSIDLDIVTSQKMELNQLNDFFSKRKPYHFRNIVRGLFMRYGEEPMDKDLLRKVFPSLPSSLIAQKIGDEYHPANQIPSLE
jgi:hypothetical protein